MGSAAGSQPTDDGRAPLRVERLQARGFRNLDPLDLAPGPRFNVVHGDNGAGKSNILEAIYYLGALTSFRSAKSDSLIRLDASAARLRGQIATDGVTSQRTVDLARGRARRLEMDGKRPRSIARWLSTVQMVLFHPGDIALTSGGPDARRGFLDRVLEQMDPTYSAALASYTKALRSRNRLLKVEGVDRRSVIAYDELLASAGAVIGSTRARLISDLSPLVEEAFQEITDAALPVVVRYQPRVEPRVQSLREALARSIDLDFARGFTAEGPHGDDLVFDVRERAPVRHHASQGQHRALVLALKIAELEALGRRTGRVPVLLLDDVSSELDRTRNRRLFSRLARLGGQVFLTTTHPEFILLESDRTDFHIVRGAVERETPALTGSSHRRSPSS